MNQTEHDFPHLEKFPFCGISEVYSENILALDLVEDSFKTCRVMVDMYVLQMFSESAVAVTG